MTVRGLAHASEQPDAAFRLWARQAGGALAWETGADGEESLTVTGPEGGARGLAPMDVDVDAAPDAALPIAAALAFAGGASRVTGVERLKEKESDRLAAAVDLLTRAGASARVERDAAGASVLAISGRDGTPRAAAFAAHADHRVAMTAAVLALVLPGATLDDASCVGQVLARLLGGVEPARDGVRTSRRRTPYAVRERIAPFAFSRNPNPSPNPNPSSQPTQTQWTYSQM